VLGGEKIAARRRRRGRGDVVGCVVYGLDRGGREDGLRSLTFDGKGLL